MSALRRQHLAEAVILPALRHDVCSHIVAWRSFLDDHLVPCLLPWCPHCRAVCGEAELTELPEVHVQIAAAEMADHLTLSRMHSEVSHERADDDGPTDPA